MYYIYIPIYMYIYIHTYIHTYLHIYMYTYIYMKVYVSLYMNMPMHMNVIAILRGDHMIPSNNDFDDLTLLARPNRCYSSLS
jgi:hypothetical protein